MNAAEIRAALLKFWPPSEYLSIDEAPQSSDRQGRKLDVLVISLWRSRGHDLDGVEIKIAMGDWRKELREAAKADWWWHHVNRFWVAVPVALAPKIREELPGGWGLLAVNDDKTTVMVKATRHEREPLDWSSTIGVMRALSGVSWNALHNEYAKGERAGLQRGKLQAEQQSGDLSLRQQFDALSGKVKAFEEASGIEISGYQHSTETGRLFALLEGYNRNPLHAAQRLERLAEDLASYAEQVRMTAGHLRAPSGTR